jgi:hypothetical protein
VLLIIVFIENGKKVIINKYMSILDHESKDDIRESRYIAEQELDKVYHSIPEWVHRLFPKLSLSEKVAKGFDYQQKYWTETFLSEVKRHEEASNFASYLIKKHNLNRFDEYFRFLLSKTSADTEEKHLLSKEEK